MRQRRKETGEIDSGQAQRRRETSNGPKRRDTYRNRDRKSEAHTAALETIEKWGKGVSREENRKKKKKSVETESKGQTAIESWRGRQRKEMERDRETQRETHAEKRRARERGAEKRGSTFPHALGIGGVLTTPQHCAGALSTNCMG